MTINIELKKTEDDSYDIFLQPLQELHFKGKVAIVTNPKIAGLHLSFLLSKLSADELFVITLPDGEEHKNMATLEFLLERLFECKLDRSSTLIAFGGGVIGDMTGFAAAMYERGISFIQIPTTLLSMVDASVGGKTGINNRFGKNLLGSFNQPLSVHIDTQFLETLPKREFAAGVAEMIKMAVMFDKEYFEFLEQTDLNDKDNLKRAVQKSVELKAKVVSEDEKERGVRAVLNYGHTFAHVIENETNYETYLHGEAVAIGMCMANVLAQKMGLISSKEKDRVAALLQKYSLPTSYKIANTEQFYQKFFLDKKSEGGKIKFILPSGIGAYHIEENADKQTVIDTLMEFSSNLVAHGEIA